MSRNLLKSVTAGLLILAALAWSGQLWAQTVAPESSPDSADSLKIAFHRDDGSLTPYSFEYGYSLMTLVYDTLMWRDKDGQPQPWLAASLQANDDFSSFTAKLADAKWHDGLPVTSADVAFSFRLFKDRFHARFTPQLTAVERIETPDRATVVFRLRSPVPGFADLPLSDVPIVPRHRWNSLGGSGLPEGGAVGSGPYRLTGYSPGEGYRLEAFESYFRGVPKVRILEVVLIDTTEERLQAIERKRVDMTPAVFPRSAANRVRSLGTRIIEGPAFAPTMLVLNTRKPPFNDANARVAVSKSIDVNRVKSAVGRAAPATSGLLHPESKWSSQEGVHRVDPVEARNLVRSLQLPKIEILAPTNDLVQLEAGEQVALALKKVGVDAVMVRTREIDLVNAIGKTGKDPTFTAAIWTGLNLASYEPSFMDSMFGRLDRSNPFSYSGFSTDELNGLLGRSIVTVSSEERMKAVGETLSYLEKQAPVVPLLFSNGVYAHRSSFQGWVFVKGSGILDKRSFIEPESRPASIAADSDEPVRRSGFSPLRVASIGVTLAAFGLIVFEVWRRLNSR